MYKKKYIVYTTLAMILVTAFTFAFAFAGTGSIRIEPPLPIATESPADFKVSVQGSDDATDPHILLVITELCHTSISGTSVEWDSTSIPILSWTKAEAKWVPPGASNGARYTVASLKDHLGTDDDVYYAFVSILGGDPIEVGEEYDITVSFDSLNPEMLVYIMGKEDGSSEFDMRVPPTIPGFVIPEIPLGSLSALLTMAASAVYYLRKK